MFDIKDEVIIKPEFIEYYESSGLAQIRKSENLSKIGRVTVVNDMKLLVQVDFWSSTPSKFTVKMEHLTLVSRASDRPDVSAEPMGAVVNKNDAQKLLAREGVIEESEMEMFEIPDFNNMEEAPKKHNAGKPMMSLIRPEFLEGLATALTYGATKYDEKRGDLPNYLQGQGFHYTEILDSLMRHLNAWQKGEDLDPESKLNHLNLASANLMFLVTYINSEKGIDDRVKL